LYLAGDDADGVKVPFRLIGSEDHEFISSIIVGTNKQNEVKDDQFWALKPFMKNLEEYCKEQDADSRIYIERRENQYRNEANERTRICKPRDLLKSVAAMFFFQPHRAARDYRGIKAEFSDKMFRDEHSVVPYHAAALAAYRIDFAIRNRRVQSAWGIYKYFVMSAVGYRFTEGAALFGLRRGQQEKVGKSIIDLVLNDDVFIDFYAKIARVLDGMIKGQGIDSREKIRDFIRTETTVKDFLTRVSRLKISR
jgi:hypothetical protein